MELALLQNDDGYTGEVRRELLSDMAEREKHSLPANLAGLALCAIFATLWGLTTVLVIALCTRLATLSGTRWASNRMRLALESGGDYEKPFADASIFLSASGIGWALFTWPAIASPQLPLAAIPLLSCVSVGVCLICSLVGLSRRVLLGFAGSFSGTILIGTLINASTANLWVPLAMLLPLVGAVPFGLGIRRQALKTATTTVENLHLREELESSLCHAEFLSRHDPLTGLHNRRALFEDYPGSAPRERVGLVMIDLDHFKAINDELGHAVGDDVLVRVGAILKSASRDVGNGQCRAYRLGGEEFVIIAETENDALDVTALGNRIREKIARRFARSSSPVQGLTASIGVAHWDPSESLHTALGNADAALYAAKEAGRNRVMEAGELKRVA